MLFDSPETEIKYATSAATSRSMECARWYALHEKWGVLSRNVPICMDAPHHYDEYRRHQHYFRIEWCLGIASNMPEQHSVGALDSIDIWPGTARIILPSAYTVPSLWAAAPNAFIKSELFWSRNGAERHGLRPGMLINAEAPERRCFRALYIYRNFVQSGSNSL